MLPICVRARTHIVLDFFLKIRWQLKRTERPRDSLIQRPKGALIKTERVLKAVKTAQSVPTIDHNDAIRAKLEDTLIEAQQRQNEPGLQRSPIVISELI